jgi:hypothetical protein
MRLTMYLAKRRKDKRLTPITIVCQFHCKIFVVHKSVTADMTVCLSHFNGKNKPKLQFKESEAERTYSMMS